MQPLWKILAPIEFEERAEFAVEHAFEFAQATAAQLVFLHVAEQERYADAGKPGWPQPAAVERPCEVPVQRVVLSGKPAAVIRRYADDIDANMVLMMPRHRGRWRMFGRESVTSAVLDSSRRPVQVWVQSADYRFRCRRILCVLALDGTDRPLLDCAVALAARTGAELSFLHVLPEISEGLLTAGIAERDRPLSRPVALDRIRELAGGLPVPYSTSILVGSVGRCISLTARQTSADLVIVGRSRQGAWTAAGSDVRALPRRVGCPVISIAVSAAPPAPGRRDRRAQRQRELCDA